MQENLLKKLTDKQNIEKIITSIMQSPKTSSQLSTDCNIPLYDVIRILKPLEDK